MLSKFSVKKPFTVVVAIVLVLILGVVSYTNMSIDLIPSINLPYAIVSTSYPGASPEQVEQTVTAPLEQGMASLSNIKKISSVSSENLSMVVLEFNEDTNMDSAMIEMRENLDMLSTYLPEEVGNSSIMKLNPDMMPIVSMSVSVEAKSDQEAAKYIENKIIPEIESIEGVASVTSTGLIQNMVDITLSEQKITERNKDIAKRYQSGAEAELRAIAKKQVKAKMDQELEHQKALLLSQGMTEDAADKALAANQVHLYSTINTQVDAIVKEQMSGVNIPRIDLTKEAVSGILSGQNVSMPSGSVKSEDSASYLVRVGDKIQSLDALKSLTVMEIPNYGSVTMSDVADIAVYDNTDSFYSRVNGNYAVVLSLQKQPDYSTANVANNVQERVNQISNQHTDVQFDTLMDQGEYVDMMISTIIQNLVVGGLLAIAILYIFLRKIRPTIIVGASIVISVITAFVLMYFSGVTLNMISMGGLALGVGMLVDNSIVVIENIFRMRSEGVDGKTAAIQGAKEVSGAITASTLTTIIVFVPIAFTQGITKQLFTDMALTIGFSLIASLIVALTLVPVAASAMMSSNFNTKPTFVSKLTNSYVKLLDKSLKHRWVSIVLAVVLLVGSVLAAFSSGTELFPSMDSGNIMVSVEMPDEYTQEQTFESLDVLSNTLRKIEDIETVGIINSGSQAQSGMMGMSGSGSTVYLLLKENRKNSTDQVVQTIRDQTADYEFDVTASGSNSDMSMMSGGQVVVNLFGRDLDDLRTCAEGVADLISKTEGTTEVDNGLGKTSQEVRVTVDKQKAIANGLTVAQVYSTINKALASDKSVTTISDNGVDYNIYIKDSRIEQINEKDLSDLTITAPSGSKVKVSEVASIGKADGFSSISRTGQERSVSATASLQDGYRSGDVNAQIAEQLKSYELPAGCRYEIAGESQSIKNTFKDLFLMMLLAVVFIYLVMVAQFQSLLSPLIVMFTIPLAFTGGFAALFLTRMPISAVSLIGLVVLIGIVVNNGIVFVDYANQQMEKGYSKHDALLRAGRNRIRPILMTALTTIIALGTMAFDTSSGGELLRPMAITTIGGLAYATLLTLFLVPAMYDIMRRKKPKQKPADTVEPSPDLN